ncbi:MAG: hypothetical protein P8Y99_03290 [Calditrichaceae bacterium]
MSLNLGRYQFEGPLESINQINDSEGIFAVVCIFNDRPVRLVHLEEGANVKSKLRNHINSCEWAKQCKGRLVFGIKYTPNLQKQGRNMIVNEIKNELNTIP